MTDETRAPLVGYMILEDWCDDMSDWSGMITGPQDPTGANLAWENPTKMIEFKAYESEKARADRIYNVLRDEIQEASRVLDILTGENEALKAEKGRCDILGHQLSLLNEKIDSLESKLRLSLIHLSALIEATEDDCRHDEDCDHCAAIRARNEIEEIETKGET